MPAGPRPRPAPENYARDQADEKLLEAAQESIGERVRFWEEQDRINQELIPRVIRQNKLLTQHISDHENLPEVAGRAVQQALTEARSDQEKRYAQAIERAKTTLRGWYDEQQRLYDGAVERASTTLRTLQKTQQEQHQSSLQHTARELREEHERHYETDLSVAVEQALLVLHEKHRKSHARIIGAVAAVSLISSVSLALALLLALSIL